VVAPSGHFDRRRAEESILWLRQHYRVRFDPSIFDQAGFLAGSDEQRRSNLNAALDDPELKAVVTMRGGHGLLRLLDTIDFDSLRVHPKWLVGFSDPTLLHLGAWSHGVASLHAANLGTLGSAEESDRHEWLDALQDPTRVRGYQGTPWVTGRARGPLVGGNLTLLVHAAAAGQLWLPEGCILVLEDVGEAPYRVDRMLAALRLSGHLHRACGLVLGCFTRCGPPTPGPTCEEVLRDAAVALGVPVLANVQFGHESPNHPLPLGLDGVLDSDEATLQVGHRPT
jgi:muramoyltetrapeptide carboxypeptidase